jgi:cell wall-associated NlpC family hydrolase
VNQRLEAQALVAIHDEDFEGAPGWCQRFVRQIIQKLYGHQFDKYFEATADQTMEQWRSSPYAVAPKHGSVPGDILFWRETEHRKNGHVAIRVHNNKVAENSTVHKHNPRGSKGYRLLSQLEEPDLIVRLPEKLK